MGLDGLTVLALDWHCTGTVPLWGCTRLGLVTSLSHCRRDVTMVVTPSSHCRRTVALDPLK